jgi:hypothetical protein
VLYWSHQPAKENTVNLIYAARFATAYAALMGGHEVGDYLVQTDAQARGKGAHTHEGRVACASHVASYTATQGAALAVLNRRLGLGMTAGRMALGLAVSGLTHYAVDRCAGQWADPKAENVPALVRAAHHKRIGKAGWLTRDPGAGALIDQAIHKGCILVAAAVIAGAAPRER